MTCDHHRDAPPPYDQHRRALSDTGSYQLVVDALALTADFRSQDIDKDGYARLPLDLRPVKRNRKASDQEMMVALTHAVVAALVHRELMAPGGWTCVPLSNTRLGRAGRYRSLAMSRTLPKFVRALEQVGWLELQAARAGKRIRERSTMRASPGLRQKVEALGCKLTDFCRVGQELIVLKDKRPPGRDERGEPYKAEWLDYADTRETERMRDEMREVNAWLEAAPIAYLGPRVDPTDRQLHRIFNDGTFESGGRLFGGFWMNTSMQARSGSPWRGNIRIGEGDGEVIVAVDYSATFLRLMYVEADVAPPRGDLYADIEGLTALGPEYRAAAKQLVSAMIANRSELSRRPKQFEPLLPPRAHIKTLAGNIRKRHRSVAHLFGQGLIGRLMRIESEILLEVLRKCRAAGLVALPVHDAVLVAESRAEEAKRIMLEAWHSVTGFEGEVGEPKRPSTDATELETTFELDALPEPREWWRVEANLKAGYRDIARRMAIELLDAAPPRELPDGEGDWV